MFADMPLRLSLFCHTRAAIRVDGLVAKHQYCSSKELTSEQVGLTLLRQNHVDRDTDLRHKEVDTAISKML